MATVLNPSAGGSRAPSPQQVPIPATAADVPGPASGADMTAAYAQMVGRAAYLWGWPLVDNAHRHAAFSQAPAPGLMGGVVPIAHNSLAMLTDYIVPDQHFVTCTNQDVVYGFGFHDGLDERPIVFQVPDFGDRFWVYAIYDARTDEISRIGKQYGTKPGFYMVVGPNWQGEAPSGIEAVLRTSTTVVSTAPRVFMDDTPEDRAAIQQVLSQIDFYPLSEFDGKMKTHDWSQLPHYPAPTAGGSGETKWVDPETFFDELPGIMKLVPPLPGEEALYRWFGSVLEAAGRDPAIKQALKDTAIAAENELISPFLEWRHNGGPAGNGWNRSTNNAAWGVDYFNRTATAKSNMFENTPAETQYFYTDIDSSGAALNGSRSYAVTFPAGQEPPVNGFWSLTLYNEGHFFHPNDLGRCSLGTKSKSMVRNADGSLTIYAGAKSPGPDGIPNWLPAPDGPFSLYIRAYWGQTPILDGSWQPPKILAAN